MAAAEPALSAIVVIVSDTLEPRAHAGHRGRSAQGRLARRHLKDRPMMIGLTHYVTLAAILFTIGIAGIILNHKNIIIILMSVELILLSVNINLIAFSTFSEPQDGQVTSPRFDCLS